MFKSLKGMPDILPGEIGKWHTLEKKITDILTLFGFQEIRTPLLESSELFTRSIGSTTDVVEKEMYSFLDKDESSISLRPEGTASVIRSYLENSLGHGNDLLKLYYMGPMFRHERPQKGRLRQFTQVGVEVIGSDHPSIDAEVLVLGMELVTALDIPKAQLEMNSVGDPACRPAYREMLQTFLRSKSDQLCDNCKRRVETNPLRVLDCKSELCQTATKDAPLMINHLCAACKSHFDEVLLNLKAADVPYHVNPRIVRGLDYYTRTAFEISADNLGSQNAVLAGGRYDGLSKELGGDPVPSIGFAAGLERLLLSSQKLVPLLPFRLDMIPLESKASPMLIRLAQQIRRKVMNRSQLVSIDVWPPNSSLKSALRRSNKLNSNLVVILGESEMQKKTALVKDLAKHTQEEVAFDALSEHIAGLIPKTA